MVSARITLAGLVLGASLHGCACEGGSETDAGVAGKLPCSAVGTWSDGAVEHHRFSYAHKQLAGVRIRDAAGEVLVDDSRGFDGDLVSWREQAGVRDDYHHDGTRLIRIARTDRALDDGDATATATYGWAGDAMITEDLEYADPARPDRHATIAGDRTERMTIDDCLVVDATRCERWVFEQPDAEPTHWVVASVDRDGDGTIDARSERVLDEEGRELSRVDTDLGPRGPVVRARTTTSRNPDGAPIRTLRETFAADGTPLPSLSLVHELACSEPRIDRAVAARTAARRPGVGDLGLVARLLDR